MGGTCPFGKRHGTDVPKLRETSDFHCSGVSNVGSNNKPGALLAALTHSAGKFNEVCWNAVKEGVQIRAAEYK